MVTFEEVKKKHEKYLAIAATRYNNKIGQNLAFLNNVRRFMKELNESIKQKKVFNSRQRAYFQAWFKRWLDLTKPYR